MLDMEWYLSCPPACSYPDASRNRLLRKARQIYLAVVMITHQ